MQQTLSEALVEFLERYYKDSIAEFAQSYPKEQTSLTVQLADIYQYDVDIHDDCIDNPDEMRELFAEALEHVELPVETSFENAVVRFSDQEEYLTRHSVGNLFSDLEGTLIAVTGKIGTVTESVTKIEVAKFKCKNDGIINEIPQSESTYQEPHECRNCERQGPFKYLPNQSETKDQRKLKLEQPPHEQSGGSGDEIVVYAYDDLIHAGGENGLPDNAGEECTIIAEYKPDMSDLQGSNEKPTYDCYLKAHDIIFESDTDNSIDVEEHREAVEAVARESDAIEKFKKSIDPGLTMTAEWEYATEMAVAWLFAAPRIDPEDGDMIRGDIHMLFVSDPGMRKSVFAKQLAEISPRCEFRQATGMASEVGLTASAEKDEFADGKWTLSPGALPRANGGHLVLDEIDKGPTDALGGIHDALEGEQKLKIDKAGIQSTMATRVGLLALGNPVDGTFSRYGEEDIAEQIDLDPALMSRFDLIMTMEDVADEEMDTTVASGVLESIDESARIEYGELEAENAEKVNRDVGKDVLKAWVKIGREEIQPLLTESAKEILQEFYVDTRQMNDEDSDSVPATARTLVAGVRIAMAFARCELSDTVEKHHAERAIRISKRVVGENYDPEMGEFDANRTTEQPTSQKGRREGIVSLLKSDGQLDFSEIQETLGITENVLETDIRKLREQGKVYEPENGTYRAT